MIPNQPSRRLRIGLDLMGADTAPSEIALAAENFLSSHPEPELSLCLLAPSSVLEKIKEAPRLEKRESGVSISPAEPPTVAVRRKKESSLVLGVEALKSGDLDALVTAGSTGALLVASRLKLTPLRGVTRPALVALLPSKQAPIAVLDVGANLKSSDRFLVECAAMGIAYQRCRGIENPTLALLNIGQEATKGTELHRKAHAALHKMAPGSFTGNIEARDLFEGKVDLVVTDGFTGNVFLKTAEGIATFLLETLDRPDYKMAEPSAKADRLEVMRKKLCYRGYPGALLCGVSGIVLKCHGNAGQESIASSLELAAQLVRGRFLERLQEEIEQIRSQ